MSEDVQVIEFALGDERYCIDIENVSEIVRVDDDMTAVPNAPRHVEGVMDLRGETTTIVDPAVLLGIDAAVELDEQILVFDPDAMDGERVGWLVDDVYRVSSLSTAEIEDAPSDQDAVRGVVNDDDGFLIWTAPEMAHAA
jgi:purine-binding chemotaxis protein CheW